MRCNCKKQLLIHVTEQVEPAEKGHSMMPWLLLLDLGIIGANGLLLLVCLPAVMVYILVYRGLLDESTEEQQQV